MKVLSWLLCLWFLVTPAIAASAPPLEIPMRHWPPQETPKATLLCLHGLGLYSGSYEAFAKRMAALGFDVYAMDIRGFGEWVKESKGCHINFNGATHDVGRVLKYLDAQNGSLPLFLLGESMGGAMAIHAAALYPQYMQAVVSSAPGGHRYDSVKTDIDVALHALAGPRRDFNIGTKIIDQATPDNPLLRAMWCGDPLDRKKLSPEDLLRFQRFMDQTNGLAEKITYLPILVIQGGDDPLVRPRGTCDIFEHIKSPKKKLLFLGDAEHLIWEDAQFNDEELHDLVAWLNAQLK